MPKALIINPGERFGRLTIIKEADCRNKRRYFLCKCDCGNEKEIGLSQLRKGHTKSCGCYQNEVRGTYSITHGQYKTRLYRIWIAMKDRCFNPKCKIYKHYGDRGITMCQEWMEFETFYSWALENGYQDNLTIDRKNNNGNYEPLNCVWTTQKQQSNNTRRNIRICYGGQEKTIKEWSEQLDIKYLVLYKRLKKGWSVEKAFNTPLQKNQYS